jgi:hypothetical protein
MISSSSRGSAIGLYNDWCPSPTSAHTKWIWKDAGEPRVQPFYIQVSPSHPGVSFTPPSGAFRF